jgi:Domain of unknown function (DUF4397)
MQRTTAALLSFRGFPPDALFVPSDWERDRVFTNPYRPIFFRQRHPSNKYLAVKHVNLIAPLQNFTWARKTRDYDECIRCLYSPPKNSWRTIMSRWLRILPLILTFAASSFFTSCGSSNAQMRMVNAIPDSAAGGLDVYFNGAKYFTGVGFPSVSPSADPAKYTSVPSGSDAVQAYATGSTSSPVFTTTPTASLGSSNAYTGVLSGFNANPSFFFVTDNNTTPTTGDVEFRFIHSSPSVQGAVDIYLVQNAGQIGSVPPNITGVAYQQASAYYSIPYSSSGWVIVVTYTGTKIPISGFSYGPYTPPNNSIRTLVLVDVPGGGQMSRTPVVMQDLVEGQ